MDADYYKDNKITNFPVDVISNSTENYELSYLAPCEQSTPLLLLLLVLGVATFWYLYTTKNKN
jgi:hypothetical protein